MPLSPEDIVRDYGDNGSSAERMNKRKSRLKIAIVEPNPACPQRFLDTKARIEAVLGSTAVAIFHAGSTSVPGFLCLFREPGWHQHRFFVDDGDRPGTYPINLHVFGPDCPEVERHRIFREWLLKSSKDLQLYATVKRECAAASEAAGESIQEYTQRKAKTVREILNGAFHDLGYVK